MGGNAEVRNVVEAAVDAAALRLKSELVDAISLALPPPVAAASGGDGGGLATFRTELFEVFAGNGQVELLNRLMVAIGTHWERCVLYLVKGEDFHPWAVQGFASTVGDAAVKAADVKGSKDTILSAALSGGGSGADNGELARILGSPHDASAAVALGIRGKAAAVVYCDGPKGESEECVAALELLARLTAAAIELGMLTKRNDPGVRTAAATATLGAAVARALPQPAAPVAVKAFVPPPKPVAPKAVPAFVPPPVVAARAPEPEPEIEFTPPPASSWAAPELKVAPAPEPEPEPEPAPPPAAVVAPVDIRKELSTAGGGAVVEAGQSLEPAQKYSRWKPVRDQIRDGEPEDASLAGIPEAERSKHVDAKKIARLLVSEIKLYNEAKVAVGRKSKDLYERLKEDIERSRATYNERVDRSIASSTDYFKDELVATLAEGDASILGMR